VNSLSKIRYVVFGTLLMATVAMQSSLAAGNERAAQMKAKLQERFAQADANGDGKLTKEEAKDKMPRVYAGFENIDADHAGYVTLEQIEQYIVSLASKRRSSSGE
jgi:Ca2+-binding EF-hand superfamily protein